MKAKSIRPLKERGIRHEPVSGLQSPFNGGQLRCEAQAHVDDCSGRVMEIGFSRHRIED